MLLTNNRIVALVTILVLGVGVISIVGTNQSVMASQIGKLCVFFACGNANITGGTLGGGSQPTPTTGTLIVTKVVSCPVNPDVCPAANTFVIGVQGNNPSPSTVQDDGKGTTVTLGPGQYTVSESFEVLRDFTITFSGNCVGTAAGNAATGNMIAGQTQTCTVTNTQNPQG